ncbi:MULTISPECIES: Mth938-like domain-containing protein [Thiomicrorhabdus]|uniref:Mth938-like domain-containing protein n=1 Tax=Thiomicrorhabdus heinhorstiae TaxID=2748010 RepID=A0ABS0BSK8_9GAMM|nr:MULTISPECIES: Mth938-like domain-containing protein [Thiomicrorhabdus]MBF6056847.1 Mth938-like domain-containing protein [Thiomicrorhabdus heinhorstiae]
MKFSEHRDSNINTIKHYSPGEVKVNDRLLNRSCFITQTEIEAEWPCADIEALDEASLDLLLEKQPEVIILGTGDRQVFPDPKLFAYCTRKGVGLEVMANDAACRTYNVITTEDREILLALILG